MGNISLYESSNRSSNRSRDKSRWEIHPYMNPVTDPVTDPETNPEIDPTSGFRPTSPMRAYLQATGEVKPVHGITPIYLSHLAFKHCQQIHPPITNEPACLHLYLLAHQIIIIIVIIEGLSLLASTGIFQVGLKCSRWLCQHR